MKRKIGFVKSLGLAFYALALWARWRTYLLASRLGSFRYSSIHF